MDRPRVNLLTQYFPPEVYPQTLWLADALLAEGFAVEVTTSIPNYPSGEVVEGYRATRAVRETIDGIPVTRTPVYPSHDHRAAGRIANYSTFALSSAWFGRTQARTADVVLVWATPATAAGAALTARFGYGTPYVLFVQDIWPDSVFATQFLATTRARAVAERALAPYLSTLYRNASHVIAITPGMGDTLIQRGVSVEKSSVIYNWVDEEVVRPMPPDGRLRAALGIRAADFVMVFAGNLGTGQALDPWIEAMFRLRNQDAIHLVFLGAGSRRRELQWHAAEADLANVYFHDPVPVTEVSAHLADADASIISLADEALFHITMPSKTAASLAQGKAVICSAPGETAETIRRAGAGWIAKPGDPAAIAVAIVAAWRAGHEEREQRGVAGRRFYTQHMSREVGAGRLSEILRTAATDRRSRAWSRSR